jgi:dolichol-phosphate mannosyltransferase
MRRPSPFFLAQAAAAVVVGRRLAPGARRLPPLVARTGPVDGTVTVVIPARDEAGRIRPCLAALAGDPQVTEVVVVDDESTDATASLARALGATVVTGRPLPPGWVGKPWALQQGLEAAAGEWVVTLDADVVPGAGLVGALVDAVRRHGYDVMTAGPRFVCSTLAEQVLHPALLATLVYRFGPVGPRRPVAPRRTMANGQCLVARRDWLRGAGGFTAAAGHMTDDIALVRALAAAGASVGFLDGSGVLEVDMHDGVGDVWREWGRSLPMADVTPWPRQLGDLAVIWLAAALPLPRIVLRRSGPLDWALLAVRAGLVVATAPAYRRPAPGTWLGPLLDVPAAARLTWAAVRPVRRWRGRTYAARPGPPAGSAGR